MYQATSPRLIVDKGGRPSIASRLIKDDPTREKRRESRLATRLCPATEEWR